MNYSVNTVVTTEGGAVTVYSPGKEPLIANDGHPQWQEILDAIASLAEYEELVLLFSPAQAVSDRFERLTDRVTVRNGMIYFDGDAVDNVITEHIVRALGESQSSSERDATLAHDDFTALVNFLEKLMTNLESDSREQLYHWLNAKDFTITADGDIVGYKGCRYSVDNVPISQNSGHAFADGVEYMHDQIPYRDGTVVEMPRSEVTFDPSSVCSVGLHVGTHSYARTYAYGCMLEVHVNPRDVVSVPSHDAEKMRVCRLTVVGEVDKVDGAYKTAFKPDEGKSVLDDVDKIKEAFSTPRGLQQALSATETVSEAMRHIHRERATEPNPDRLKRLVEAHRKIAEALELMR